MPRGGVQRGETAGMRDGGAVSAGNAVSPPSVDAAFLSLAEKFCCSLVQERNLSVHTARNYRIDLLDFGRWAAREGVDPLSPTHRQARMYLGELDRARYSRRTVNRRLSSMRSFFRWLVMRGIVEDDPIGALQGPKVERGLPRTMSSDDIARLIGAWEKDDTPEGIRNRAILEFLYASGARISEASGLLLRGVSFALGQAKIYGKGGKERIVPLHEASLQAMRDYLDRSRPYLVGDGECPCFFVSSRGRRMSPDAIRRMFKASLRRAGLDESLVPHDVRHSFATDLVEGGADLRSVQEMLGHASLSTTQIYTHLSVSHLKAACRQAHPRG